MGKLFRILTINPGSTSTKLAVYENESLATETELEVERSAVSECRTVFDQYDIRINTIEKFLSEAGYKPGDFDCVASRGCAGGNQKAGAYLVDEAYIQLCRGNGIPHISSLSPILARTIAEKYGTVAYVYDAEGVNERDPRSLLSGLKEVGMNAGSHTLNAKIVARKAAAAVNKEYEKAVVVVCHMGGGVSTSCHKYGRLVDSAYEAYAPERSGGIPGAATLNFVHLCFSGQYTEAQVRKLLMGAGGLVSYTGISDLREIERRIAEGDKEIELYYDGMIYGLAKDIAAMSSVACMEVDAIALTGGMAKSKQLVERLSRRVEKIAPIVVLPGSYEMENLATGSLRVLRGEESCHHFGSDD